VLLVVAILLAVFVLPEPWNIAAVIAGLLGEMAEATFGIWYSRRRRAAIGAEAMVGSVVRVVEACRPKGRASYKGELWDAVCASGAESGERVRIDAVDGLVLVVERIREP
jgi:membrane-bound ClpP family serine protease